MSLVSFVIQQDAKRHVCLISFKILIFCLARFMMYMTLPEARKLQAAPMCITKFINEKKIVVYLCMCADGHRGNRCALLTVSSRFVLDCLHKFSLFNAAALRSYCSNFRQLSAGLMSLL